MIQDKYLIKTPIKDWIIKRRKGSILLSIFILFFYSFAISFMFSSLEVENNWLWKLGLTFIFSLYLYTELIKEPTVLNRIVGDISFENGIVMISTCSFFWVLGTKKSIYREIPFQKIITSEIDFPIKDKKIFKRKVLELKTNGDEVFYLPIEHFDEELKERLSNLSNG